MLFRLHGDEAHDWSGHCFADRLHVRCISIASLHVRLQASTAPDGRVHRARGSIVSRGTSLHADKARGQLGKELQHLRTAKLATDERLTLRIDGVDLEHVLGQIEADNDNLLGYGRLL